MANLRDAIYGFHYADRRLPTAAISWKCKLELISYSLSML